MAIGSLKTHQSAFCRVGCNETRELGRYQVMQALESQQGAGVLVPCTGKTFHSWTYVCKTQHSHLKNATQQGKVGAGNLLQ